MADVVLPALGESITEGIITKWFKAVGDEVARDEPLLEISTDKVDSELPSPAAGVLTQILAEEGDTVPVGATVAVIGDAGAAGPPASSGETKDPVATEPAPSVEAPAVDAATTASSATTPPATPPSAPGRAAGTTSSPMVRKLLADAGVDASDVASTGPGGRITPRRCRAGQEHPEADGGTSSCGGRWPGVDGHPRFRRRRGGL